MKVEDGEYFVKSGDSWVPALDDEGNAITDDNPIKVHKDLEITGEDIKSATIIATDAEGKPIDNAFYVSGYSANSPSNGENWQVRIEGSFKVANLPALNPGDVGYDPNPADVMAQRLQNRIYYSVSTVKRNEPLTLTYNGVELYNDQHKKMDLTADVSITSDKIDYWDAGNKCPPLSWGSWNTGGRSFDTSRVVRWQDGAIFTASDWSWNWHQQGWWWDYTNGKNDQEQWCSGIDYELAGDKVESKAELLGMEVTKYILDEAGNQLALSKEYYTEHGALTSRFHVYEKTADVASYDTDDVKALNGADAIRKTNTLPETSATAPSDSLYNGYEPHTEYDLTTTIGDNGKGLAHNYNVTEGMYYIVEDPASVAQTVVAENGSTYRYLETIMESEYAWRDDEYTSINYGGTYNEPVHASPTYSVLSGQSVDTYRSIPEVIGNYKDQYGNWIQNDGTALRNVFLPFYVYNVYVADVELEVEKKWVGNAPEGAEVIVDLYYAKRKVQDATSGAVSPVADWPAKANYAKATEEDLFNSTNTPNMVKQITLSANSEPDAWKGSFTNLPKRLTDADGNVWEFDYYAKEVSVTVGGEDITNQYDAAENKIEPTEEEARLSDGKVAITNQPAIDITVVKVAKDDVDDASASTTRLPGATFTVTKYTNNAYQQKDTSWGDDDGQGGKKGSKTIADSTPPTGKFSFTELPIGYYQISEDVAPAGYVKAAEAPRFRINANQTVDLLDASGNVIEDNKTDMFKIENKTVYFGNEPGKPLPNTGGEGTTGIMLFGSVIMLAGLGMLANRRRRCIG